MTRRTWRRRPGWTSRAELEAELHFWRNYAALTRFSPKLTPVVVPAQRVSADPRWDALQRSGRRPPPRTLRR